MNCKDLFDKYTSHMNLSFCNGGSMIDPKKTTDQDIEKWYEFERDYVHGYRYKTYRFFDFLCAMDNRKIAMIDNDFLPDNYKHLLDDGGEDDMLFRYLSLFKCSDMNLKYLVIIGDDDPTTIFYRKDKWEDALILYLYHENRLKNLDIELTDDAKYPQWSLHIFQGILLGYDINSIFYYAKFNEYDLWDYIESMIKKWPALSKKDKRLYYEKIYEIIFTKNIEEYEIVVKLCEHIKDEIEKIKKQIRLDPKWKIFACGLEDDTKLHII